MWSLEDGAATKQTQFTMRTTHATSLLSVGAITSFLLLMLLPRLWFTYLGVFGVLTALAVATVTCVSHLDEKRNAGPGTVNRTCFEFVAVATLLFTLGRSILAALRVSLGRVEWVEFRPGYHIPLDTPLVVFVLLLVGMGLVVLSYAFGEGRAAKWRVPTALTLYLLMGAWTIQHSPRPYIDVWYFQERACQLILDGRNPYGPHYPAIYPNPESHYGQELLKDGKLISFPYPPASLLFVLPSYVLTSVGGRLGDVRWALLLASTAAAGLIVAMGRRRGLSRGHWAELGPIALLCHPHGMLIIENAWTEPLIGFAAASTAYFLAANRPGAASTGVGTLLAVKQYGLFWLPVLWRTGKLPTRSILYGCALASFVTLPFAVWNFGALWDGVVTFHLATTIRPDAVTFHALVFKLTGRDLSSIWGFAAMLIVGGLVIRFAAPGLASAAMGGAALYLSFFVFNKQAFINYYWFCLVLLLIAAVAGLEPKTETSRPAQSKRKSKQ